MVNPEPTPEFYFSCLDSIITYCTYHVDKTCWCLELFCLYLSEVPATYIHYFWSWFQWPWKKIITDHLPYGPFLRIWALISCLSWVFVSPNWPYQVPSACPHKKSLSKSYSSSEQSVNFQEICPELSRIFQTKGGLTSHKERGIRMSHMFDGKLHFPWFPEMN